MPIRDAMKQGFVVVASNWTREQVRAYVRGLQPEYAVIRRQLSPVEVYYYLYPWDHFAEALALYAPSGPTENLERVFQLHEYTSTPQADPDEPAVPNRAVVVQGDRVVGVVYTDAPVYRGDPVGGDPGGGGTRGAGSETAPAPEPFSAEPRLDAPEEVAPAATFDVTVGFRSDRDPRLGQVQPIFVAQPAPGQQLLVLLTAEGAEVAGTGYAQLPLDIKSSAVFTCTTRPDAGEVVLKVQYVYGSAIVGGAVRRVAVKDATAATLAGLAATAGPPTPLTVGDPCRLGLPDAADAVDVVLSVLKASGDDLEWCIFARQPAIADVKLRRPVQNASQFARDVEQKLNKAGPFAFNALGTIGQNIADCMPDEVFLRLREVQAALGRIPTVLLLTDEPYVPWELAHMAEPLFDPAAPATLGGQTVLGRWWFADKVMLPPPATLGVERITAVAGQYGLASGWSQLMAAEEEGKWLAETYDAVGLGATEDDLVPLCTLSVPGHLIHFALHGLSDPSANTQGIVLQNAKVVAPEDLIGAYRCGDVPRFAFVFFNACQVGTPGASLGLPAGFPGTFVRGGARGFIAPLWEVKDDVAHGLARRFYQAAFDDGQAIGDILRDLRRQYDKDQHTTPMAYIYYGHPKLRLQRQTD